VIAVTKLRDDALARLDVFVGEWVMEVRFPGGPPPGAAGGPSARATFEWALGRQFLLQRTTVPDPAVPDSLALIGAGLETGAYTQHYYDSRGVARLYAMTLDAAGVWTLSRESPDFTPLDFRQRYTGTFSADGNVISGAWEIGLADGGLRHDFDLNYRRAG
jgi:hypothetical protein